MQHSSLLDAKLSTESHRKSSVRFKPRYYRLRLQKLFEQYIRHHSGQFRRPLWFGDYRNFIAHLTWNLIVVWMDLLCIKLFELSLFLKCLFVVFVMSFLKSLFCLLFEIITKWIADLKLVYLKNISESLVKYRLKQLQWINLDILISKALTRNADY